MLPGFDGIRRKPKSSLVDGFGEAVQLEPQSVHQHRAGNRRQFRRSQRSLKSRRGKSD